MKVQRVVVMGKRSIEDMTEEEAKVLAMLIDTDGCIYATTRGRKRNITLGVRVGMSGKIPVDMVMLWGGRLFKHTKKTGKKYYYTWAVSKRELLRSFLIKIKPHLIQKQKQAELALKMCDILDEKPEGYKKRLEELRIEIRKLNQAPAPDIDITKLIGKVR